MVTTLTEPNQRVLLPGVSWATYQSLRNDYAGFRGVRINYDRGTLEIVTPGFDHEGVNRNIEDIASTIADVQDRDTVLAGSTTFKREDLERGFEPDSSFYFEHTDEIRGKRVLDLAVDPAPDLVIEVDSTSLSLDKLPLYASVGVREIWRYREGQMTIFGLQTEAGNATYTEREFSIAFPALSRQTLEELVAQSWTLRRPDWMRRVRQWAEDNRPDTST
jgi:Uma2 family endonuclease